MQKHCEKDGKDPQQKGSATVCECIDSTVCYQQKQVMIQLHPVVVEIHPHQKQHIKHAVQRVGMTEPQRIPGLHLSPRPEHRRYASLPEKPRQRQKYNQQTADKRLLKQQQQALSKRNRFACKNKDGSPQQVIFSRPSITEKGKQKHRHHQNPFFFGMLLQKHRRQKKQKGRPKTDAGIGVAQPALVDEHKKNLQKQPRQEESAADLRYFVFDLLTVHPSSCVL